MSPQFSEDDVGKAVETGAGESVGVVSDVDGGTAYVDPDPGVADSIKAALDWSDASDDALPIAGGAVDRITDEAVRLEREFSAEGDEPGEMEGDDAGDRPEWDRQDETDAEPEDRDERGREPEERDGEDADPDRQDETAPEPDDLDETDLELDDFDDADPGVQGDPDDTDLSDAGGEIDGDRERRTDPATDPVQDAGGGDGSEAAGDRGETESGTRDDVDVDPTDLTDGEPDVEIDPEEDV